MNASDLLNYIPLFREFSLEDRMDLCALFSEQMIDKGEMLFQKDSQANNLYVIQEGVIKIVITSKTGDEMIVSIFSKGDFFGEMSLLDGLPRSAHAVAMEPTRLLLLSRNNFIRFLKKNDAAMEAVLSSLTQRLRKADDLLIDITFLTIPARFAKKLLELGDTMGKKEGDGVRINLQLSQKDLADMVGATRQSINKELRALTEKGLVSTTTDTICIHDVERLRSRIM